MKIAAIVAAAGLAIGAYAGAKAARRQEAERSFDSRATGDSGKKLAHYFGQTGRLPR